MQGSMNDLTNEELVTLLAALNAYAVGKIKRAAYQSDIADLQYVLMGGSNDPVGKASELSKRLVTELERRKAQQCSEANKSTS